jgi:sugar O-acyltransferase (sialic acid O-acetyltransferase NeuD family)
MNRHLYILGAGGLGKELGAYIKYVNSDFMLSGYYDDGETGSVDGLGKIIGTIKQVNQLDAGDNLLMAVGDPARKAQFFSTIKMERFNFPYFIQPNVYISDRKSIELGKGSVICAGSSLTTTVEIGDHVLINLNCTIGHDVTIGNFSSIMPGVNISGSVKIGKGVLIGTGASILQNIKIGDNATVGAGAVVTKDVPDGKTAIGIPAKW